MPLIVDNGDNKNKEELKMRETMEEYMIMEEKIEEYSEKYEIPENVVRDILEEGWDLCCNSYENMQGKVKKEIIKEQYPELFEDQVELDIVNENVLIDIVGTLTHSVKNEYITQQEAKEKLREIKPDIQTKLIRDNGYQNAKSLMFNKIYDFTKDILEEEVKECE